MLGFTTACAGAAGAGLAADLIAADLAAAAFAAGFATGFALVVKADTTTGLPVGFAAFAGEAATLVAGVAG